MIAGSGPSTIFGGGAAEPRPMAEGDGLSLDLALSDFVVTASGEGDQSGGNGEEK